MTQHPLADALNAVLDHSGARGTYNALKYADAVEAAEKALAQYENSDTAPASVQITVDQCTLCGTLAPAAFGEHCARPECPHKREAEKSDTDRDQLREALETLDRVIQFGLMPEGLHPDQADRALERVRAALASKTAIDPATVEADVARNHIIAARTFLVINETEHADRHLEDAIRALGKDQ